MKTSTARSLAFFLASGMTLMWLSLSSNWIPVTFTAVPIVCCVYFGFEFTTLNRKLYRRSRLTCGYPYLIQPLFNSARKRWISGQRNFAPQTMDFGMIVFHFRNIFNSLFICSSVHWSIHFLHVHIKLLIFQWTVMAKFLGFLTFQLSEVASIWLHVLMDTSSMKHSVSRTLFSLTIYKAMKMSWLESYKSDLGCNSVRLFEKSLTDCSQTAYFFSW